MFSYMHKLVPSTFYQRIWYFLTQFLIFCTEDLTWRVSCCSCSAQLNRPFDSQQTFWLSTGVINSINNSWMTSTVLEWELLNSQIFNFTLIPKALYFFHLFSGLQQLTPEVPLWVFDRVETSQFEEAQLTSEWQNIHSEMAKRPTDYKAVLNFKRFFLFFSFATKMENRKMSERVSGL